MSECPNATKYGDRVCIRGYMWELTYSECAPPDQRQNTGEKCPHCHPKRKKRLVRLDKGE